MTESSGQPGPAGFSYPGHGVNSSLGIALCHGFTGSPLSILPWAEHLAAQGFAVSVPLLPGHGTNWQELAGSRWRDWHLTFEEAYLDLAGKTQATFVAGLSMGGAIALLTASRHPVAGVSVVNPGLSFYDRRVRLISVLKHFQTTTLPIVEENVTAAVTNDGDYSRTPLAAVHELKKLFTAAVRALPAVKAPVQVFRSMTDAVVPPTSLAILQRGLPMAPAVIDLPASGHVATLDADAPKIFTASVDFFYQQADRGAAPAAGNSNRVPVRDRAPSRDRAKGES